HSPRLCSLMKQNLSGKCRVHGQELVYHSLYRNGPDISLEIIKAINAATSKIYVAMFIISHDAILEALDRAHRRGVNVVLIVDNIQKHTTFSILQKLGSKVKLLEYGDSGCLHCKICIIDGKDFIIGSANWSKRGFSGNLESVLFVKGMTPSQKEGVNKFWTHLLSYSHEVTPENVNIGRKRMLQQGEREEKEEN
ncbi:phospholipase D-like domain-containing protein, partial [Chlamydia pecorum]